MMKVWCSLKDSCPSEDVKDCMHCWEVLKNSGGTECAPRMRDAQLIREVEEKAGRLFDPDCSK